MTVEKFKHYNSTKMVLYTIIPYINSHRYAIFNALIEIVVCLTFSPNTHWLIVLQSDETQIQQLLFRNNK